MDDKIIAIFCLCDDLLKAMHHLEDTQRQMNDAEIMTRLLYFGGYQVDHHLAMAVCCLANK